jgi:hypothetical protein
MHAADGAALAHIGPGYSASRPDVDQCGAIGSTLARVRPAAFATASEYVVELVMRSVESSTSSVPTTRIAETVRRLTPSAAPVFSNAAGCASRTLANLERGARSAECEVRSASAYKCENTHAHHTVQQIQNRRSNRAGRLGRGRGRAVTEFVARVHIRRLGLPGHLRSPIRHPLIFPL